MLLPHALRSIQKGGIQFVGGLVTSFVGAVLDTPTDISLSGTLSGGIASSPSEGDVIFVVYSIGSNSSLRNINVNTAGYLLVGTKLYANDTYDNHLVAYIKVAGPSETSVQVTGTGSTNDAGAVAIHVWRGIDEEIIVEAIQQISIANSALINPPSITPSTPGAIVIAGGGSAHITSLVYNTPALLSNFIQTNGADTYDTTVAIGSGVWTSGAFDVAQFTLSSGVSSTTYSNNSFSIALKPGPSSPLDYPTIIGSTNNAGLSDSATFDKPTGTAEGDLLVIVAVAKQNNTPVTVISPPSGFATNNSTSTTSFVQYIFTKVAGPSEPSTYTALLNVSVEYSVSCVAIRDATTTGAVYGSASQVTSSTQTASGVSVNGSGLVFAFYSVLASRFQVYPPSMCVYVNGSPNSANLSSFLYARKVNASVGDLTAVFNGGDPYASQQFFLPRA